MEKEDKNLIIRLIGEHEFKVLSAMGGLTIWMILQIFSLKEAQAVQQTDIKYTKEKVDMIYDLILKQDK